MVELYDGNVNLVIEPAQVAAFESELTGLTSQDGVKCALLIDTAGKIIAGTGGLGMLEPASVAALAAGDFATTRALAHRVGEKDFTLVFQREKELNVYLNAVSDEAILVLLFDSGQGLGTIRMLVRQAQKGLRGTLDSCRRSVVSHESLHQTLEAPTAVDEPQETAKAAPVPKLVANPPADVIRKFWRIKVLAEDCLKRNVPTVAPEAWKEARARTARVAQAVASGDHTESRRLLGELERLLMRAYEDAISERKGADTDWETVEFWQKLVNMSTDPFTKGLLDMAPGILLNVDRDSVKRHAQILGSAKAGMIPREALAPIRGWPGERRLKALANAFLDLLLNRLWVVDKLFGPTAGERLVALWKQEATDREGAVTRLGLAVPVKYLLERAERRTGTTGEETK
jgi:predicted regulator of Ras-like GTPase activity (Roadblock/LC7/MglB family)